ncbi:hypothetical protein MRX96_024541 [Rhipicephalus microplus]
MQQPLQSDSHSVALDLANTSLSCHRNVHRIRIPSILSKGGRDAVVKATTTMVGSRERSKRQPRVFAPAHLLHSTVQSQRRLLCTPVKGCYWLRFTITDARLPFAQGERENIPSTKALQRPVGLGVTPLHHLTAVGNTDGRCAAATLICFTSGTFRRSWDDLVTSSLLGRNLPDDSCE